MMHKLTTTILAVIIIAASAISLSAQEKIVITVDTSFVDGRQVITKNTTITKTVTKTVTVSEGQWRGDLVDPQTGRVRNRYQGSVSASAYLYPLPFITLKTSHGYRFLDNRLYVGGVLGVTWVGSSNHFITLNAHCQFYYPRGNRKVQGKLGLETGLLAVLSEGLVVPNSAVEVGVAFNFKNDMAIELGVVGNYIPYGTPFPLPSFCLGLKF